MPENKRLRGAAREGGGGERDKRAWNCRAHDAWEPACGVLFQSSFRFSISQLVINFASIFELLLLKNAESKRRKLARLIN